jgi:hypothetical protein
MRGRGELSGAQWKLIEPILLPKRRADRRGGPWQDTRAVRTYLAWSAWVACKSCSRIYERLLVPQRHYGIDLGRTAGGNEACQECNRRKDNHYRCIRNEISRADLK